jgi:hypothetical protein
MISRAMITPRTLKKVFMISSSCQVRQSAVVREGNRAAPPVYH